MTTTHTRLSICAENLVCLVLRSKYSGERIKQRWFLPYYVFLICDCRFELRVNSILQHARIMRWALFLTCYTRSGRCFAEMIVASYLLSSWSGRATLVSLLNDLLPFLVWAFLHWLDCIWSIVSVVHISGDLPAVLCAPLQFHRGTHCSFQPRTILVKCNAFFGQKQ